MEMSLHLAPLLGDGRSTATPQAFQNPLQRGNKRGRPKRGGRRRVREEERKKRGLSGSKETRRPSGKSIEKALILCILREREKKKINRNP